MARSREDLNTDEKNSNHRWAKSTKPFTERIYQSHKKFELTAASSQKILEKFRTHNLIAFQMVAAPDTEL